MDNKNSPLKKPAAKAAETPAAASKAISPKPEAPKPAAPKPAASKPAAPKPAASKPAAPKPAASKPVVSKPVAPIEHDEDDDDDDDDEDDDVLDFSRLSDQDDDSTEDEDSGGEQEHLVADSSEVFDLDQFKKGSFFDQEGAEKAFTQWKAKRARKQPEWFVNAVKPTVDEIAFAKAQRAMTMRLIEAYKAKLQKVQEALTDPNLSKRDLKNLHTLKLNYEKNIQQRTLELK